MVVNKPVLALPVVVVDIDAIHKRKPVDNEQVRLLREAVARYARAKAKAEWWHVLNTPDPIEQKAA